MRSGLFPVLELIISACWDSETTVPLELYRFIPLCCHFESYDPDPEVASLSACTLSGFARTLIQPKNVNFVLGQLTQVNPQELQLFTHFMNMIMINLTGILFVTGSKFHVLEKQALRG